LSAGYSKRSLPDKLGIKPGATIVLIGAPEDFATTLGDLPPGAALRKTPRGAADLRLAFARDAKELEKRFAILDGLRDGAHFWVCWPKRTGPMAGELDENAVRDAGLALGFVDYKVCAVDECWSGLKFAPRKA
jgi:hypothetical protein